MKEIESNSELMATITELLKKEKLRQELDQSFDGLSYSQIDKIFEERMEIVFDSLLPPFFDKLYTGMIKTLRGAVLDRLDGLEKSVLDLKNSLLMAAIMPGKWREVELIREVDAFLDCCEGQKATVVEIAKHLELSRAMLIPGRTRKEKWVYLTELLRNVDNIREMDGLIFEKIQLQVVEEDEAYGTSQDHRRVLRRAISNLGKEEARTDRD